jgi:hypothetical protein
MRTKGVIFNSKKIFPIQKYLGAEILATHRGLLWFPMGFILPPFGDPLFIDKVEWGEGPRGSRGCTLVPRNLQDSR